MPDAYAPINAPNNGATIAAQLTPQTIWAKQFESFEDNGDFYKPVEGTGPNAIVVVKNETSAGNGQKMQVRVESGFGDEPHFADETFGTEDDFEALLYEDYDLTVDYIRHATSWTERAEELIGIRNEIKDGVPGKLGDWLGRRKSEELDMMFREETPTDNVFYAGGKTLHTLGTANGLGWNDIMNTSSALQVLGGQAGKLGTFRTGNTPALGLSLIATSEACTNLRQDSTYVDYAKNAGVRGDMNSLFSGQTTMVDGIGIVDRRVIDGDLEGAIGSPQNPRARLGVAVTAGTTAFDIKGGGNATSAAKTKKKFFKHFAGYAYKFATGASLAPASASRYVLIVNPANAATDPGKVGMYEYTTGNDGNKITITKRLGSATSGVRNTTVGDVVWNDGVWTGKHTDVHPIGALIIPCNSKGVPIGYSFMLGKAAALRGYGKHRGLRTTEVANGGMTMRTYITSVFGQRLRIDRIGRAPGIAVLVHALKYPHLNLPTVA